jgi:hypothetical protein
VSASNQLKAYDRVFVAGQAAVDRILGELLWFDPQRLVPVGRPQLTAPSPRPGTPTGPATVLYAPTWEGAQASMAYSSVLSHGVPLVRSLFAEGFRVVYRPHPRTGANRSDMARADAAVRAVFEEPAARRAGAVVTEVPLADAFAAADALITDVSSLAVEWLPTRRPLVVTVPAEQGAAVGRSRLLDTVPRLRAEEAGAAGRLISGRLEDDVEAAARDELMDYYLGGPPGTAALGRFIDACDTLLKDRDAACAALGTGR